MGEGICFSLGGGGGGFAVLFFGGLFLVGWGMGLVGRGEEGRGEERRGEKRRGGFLGLGDCDRFLYRVITVVVVFDEGSMVEDSCLDHVIRKYRTVGLAASFPLVLV